MGEGDRRGEAAYIFQLYRKNKKKGRKQKLNEGTRREDRIIREVKEGEI